MQVVFTHLRPRDTRRRRCDGNLGDLFVPFLLGEVDQLTHGHHADPELVAVARDHLLRRVWIIEGCTGRVHAGTGIIAPYKQIVGAIIPPDQGVPQRFTGTGQAHGQGEQRQQDTVRGVIARG